MADFSRYNTGPSPEWAGLAATLPAQPPLGDPDTTPMAALLGMQAALNAQGTAAAAEKMPALAPQLAIKDYTIPSRPGGTHTLPARTYRPLSLPAGPKPACLIWFHGNGLFYGTLDTEGPGCARMALGAGVVVLHVQYRGTPQHVYPAMIEDAEDVVSWVLEGGGADVLGVDVEKVVVGGSSGGACMTASVVLGRNQRAAEGLRRLAGQVLMVPVVVGMDYYEEFYPLLKDRETSSMAVNGDNPTFGLKDYKFFSTLVKMPLVQEHKKKILINPGLAKSDEVKGLPPTVLGVAGQDMLRDEGLFYGKLLAENGVPTDVHVFKGVPHLFRDFMGSLPAADRSEQVVIEGVAWILSKPTASGKFEVKEE